MRRCKNVINRIGSDCRAEPHSNQRLNWILLFIYAIKIIVYFLRAICCCSDCTDFFQSCSALFLLTHIVVCFIWCCFSFFFAVDVCCAVPEIFFFILFSVSIGIGNLWDIAFIFSAPNSSCVLCLFVANFRCCGLICSSVAVYATTIIFFFFSLVVCRHYLFVRVFDCSAHCELWLTSQCGPFIRNIEHVADACIHCIYIIHTANQRNWSEQIASNDIKKKSSPFFISWEWKWKKISIWFTMAVFCSCCYCFVVVVVGRYFSCRAYRVRIARWRFFSTSTIWLRLRWYTTCIGMLHYD